MAQKIFPPADINLAYVLTEILNHAPTWQEGLSKALIPMRDHFVFDNVAVYLISEQTMDATIAFARASGRGRNSEADAFWGLSIVEPVISRREVILINEVAPLETDRLRQPIKLGVPLIYKQKVLGALIFIRFGTPPYLPDQVEFATAFADFLSIKIQATLLEEENAQLQSSLEMVRAQEDFISMLSHEVRTPLGFIKGYSSTLLREDVQWDDATRLEFLKIIDKETDNLQSFLNNLIESARLQLGRISLKIDNHDLREFLNETETLMKNRYPNVNINFASELEDDVAAFDRTKIPQVLENLITNAVKYAPGSPINILSTLKNGVLKFEVKDAGPGIPEKYQEKIFDRFFRVPTNKPSQHGSGLGLYICKQIINAHQGKILLQSSAGEGTTFIITLPAHDEALEQKFGLLT